MVAFASGVESRGPHRVTTSGRNSIMFQTHSSTFLGSDTVGVEVVQCTGCRACYWAVVSCATVGSGLCRVLPNDFLRTQTRGMLLWRWPPAPFSHAPSTMSACTKAHWALEQSQVIPRLPKRLPPQQCPPYCSIQSEPNSHSACKSFTVGKYPQEAAVPKPR